MDVGIMGWLFAGMGIFFVWRMAPHAIDQLKNGPKGSTSEWLNAGLLLLGVVVFVFFLMSIV